MKEKEPPSVLRLARLLVCLGLAVLLTSAACATPYFLVDSELQWHNALLGGNVKPMMPHEWPDYMAQWALFLVDGEPYPANEFLPPQLYVWPGGATGYPEDAGLVMVWGEDLTIPGSYSSAWKWDYVLDPDLSNATINLTVTAPQFGPAGQINNVSFGIQDAMGNIRSWHWNVGPMAPIPWGVPTQLTINTALVGTAATMPVASGFANNPMFNPMNSIFFIVDENAAWVGGPQPVPPPGQQLPGMWNYWHNIVVTPNPPAKPPLQLKWSQPPVEAQPGLQPPVFYGWDERSSYQWKPIMADDWLCKDANPVTDIHWWGSFIGWDQPYPPPMPVAFHIGIWTDVPAGADGKFSHPGVLVWENYCQNFEWNFAGYDKDPRGLFENEACFQFNQFLKPEEYFYQDPSGPDGTVYWLSIAPIYQEPPQYPWGWKTRPHFFNDDAVRIFEVEPAWPPVKDSQWAAGEELVGPDGVSWDLAFELSTIIEEPKLDWGDAPDPTYPTLAVNNGACHVVGSGIYLGATVDTESDGQPDANATGDDLSGTPDEDGVVFNPPIRVGQPATLTVTASSNCMLDAWIDFNANGSWADPGEQVFVSIPLVPGLNALSFPVPASAVAGQTFARFRCSANGGLSFAGLSPDGEIEDYSVYIEPPEAYKWVQHPDLSPLGIDVNATSEYILADDFLCKTTEAVTAIRIWGSWYHDVLPFQDPSQVVFRLSFHKDIPADQSPTGYSMPGEVLWYNEFQPGSFLVKEYMANINEGWMDPPELYEFPGDHVCWQYDFDLTRMPFIQTGTPERPVVYWLDVQAVPLTTDARFGWKTSIEHWNDDAVWGTGVEPYLGPWRELRYPPNHELYPQSIDLAFALAGGDVPIDWGDAPDPTYPTLTANNGAYHVIVPNLYLGAGVDPEPDGQPDPGATGDDVNGIDDEDGVVLGSSLQVGQPAVVTVTASMACKLDAWIDFNANGTWADAGEQIFVSVPLVAGPNPLTFNVPNWATAGPTFARFRCSSVGGLSYSGGSPDGEIEDYSLRIEPAEAFKWLQRPDLNPTGIDVNATSALVLADDFRCTVTGPLTDIRLWGSWYHDVLPLQDPGLVTFRVAIHKDIPADQSPTGYSIPGETLWFREFAPGTFAYKRFASDINEGWMDPPAGYEFPGDHVCWQYDIHIADEPFVQIGTPDAPVVYWLAVQAVPVDLAGRFGWKTSLDHWNDDAVWYPDQSSITKWGELIYPPGHQMAGTSIDLAFAIAGTALNPGSLKLAVNHVIPNHMWKPWDPDPENEMMSFTVAAGPEESVTWNSVTLEAYGTGNDANEVLAAKLWLDNNNDGLVDPVDTLIGSGVYTVDNGTVTIAVAAGVDVPAGGLLNALVSYKMLTALPIPAGSTFQFNLTGAAGTGTISGLPVPVTLSPDPLVSARKTVAKKPITIGEAKQLTPVGTLFYLENKEITADFTNPTWPAPWRWVYIEEPDRSNGIGMIMPLPGPYHVGDRVSVVGHCVLVNGSELMMVPQEIMYMLQSPSLTPLAMNNKYSGGGVFGGQPAVVDQQPLLLPVVPTMSMGLNNIGSLIRTWGRVTGYGGVTIDAAGNKVDVFWIDDGSNLHDGYITNNGEPSRGIAVVTPQGMTNIPTGYWGVTGILRAIKNPQGHPVRLLVPRDFLNDLTHYPEPDN